MNLEHIYTNWQVRAANFIENSAPKLIVILLVSAVLLVLLRVLTRRLNEYSKTQPLPSGLRAQQLRTLASVIRSVGDAVIFFVAALQVLPLFGVDVKPILASAGIAGLAVGFGAQTFVKDVINGFFILLENQYDVGDTVRVAGVSGTVESMTLRRTTLRDPDGTVHVVPNSEIKVVSNMTRDWAQVSLHVSTDYKENSERVIGLLRVVAAEMFADAELQESLVAQPEVPGIDRIIAGEVKYLVLARVVPGQQHRVSRELRRRIKESFEKNKVQTPVPTATQMADTQRDDRPGKT